MSNDQIDEYEQGERVRKWLRDNGGAMFAGVAVALALLAGWEWWKVREENARVEAASQYARFAETLEGDKPEAADALATSLARDFPETPYGALAALELAERLAAANKGEEALGKLTAALPLTREAALRDVIALRAARVEWQLGKLDDAAKRLAGLTSEALAAQRNELLGDVLAAQGKRDDARNAYRDALTSLDSASPTRLIVELKLADAGGDVPEA
jgi:predicted negative regulator of RcsB-dependent stress response